MIDDFVAIFAERLNKTFDVNFLLADHFGAQLCNLAAQDRVGIDDALLALFLLSRLRVTVNSASVARLPY